MKWMIFNQKLFGRCLSNDNICQRDVMSQTLIGMVAWIVMEVIKLRGDLQKHESTEQIIILLRNYMENVLGIIVRIIGLSREADTLSWWRELPWKPSRRRMAVGAVFHQWFDTVT